MTIGIDISQLVYEGTGVGGFVKNLVEHMISSDTKNSYVLFGSSLRKNAILHALRESYKTYSHVRVVIFPFPPTFLDLLWNKLHIVPIEWFIGKVDVFIASDWTQPPTVNAKRATILYDMIVFTNPRETATTIVAVQKRRLAWVKKEIDLGICISEATKLDTMKLLGLPAEKLTVVYPGF